MDSQKHRRHTDTKCAAVAKIPIGAGAVVEPHRVDACGARGADKDPERALIGVWRRRKRKREQLIKKKC